MGTECQLDIHPVGLENESSRLCSKSCPFFSGLEVLAMDQKGYRRGSFQSSTSDEDMLEIAGASLDFPMADDDPPLDREMGGNIRASLCFFFFHRVFW